MSESRRMDPADVSDDMVTIMLSQFLTAPPGQETYEERLRRALAAYLPEFERQVREKVAEEIEQNGGTGSGCLWNAATLAAAEIARGEHGRSVLDRVSDWAANRITGGEAS